MNGMRFIEEKKVKRLSAFREYQKRKADFFGNTKLTKKNHNINEKYTDLNARATHWSGDNEVQKSERHKTEMYKMPKRDVVLGEKTQFYIIYSADLVFWIFFSFFIFLKKQNPTSRSSLWENAFSYSAAERRAHTPRTTTKTTTTYDFFSLIYLNKRPNRTACIEENIHRKKVHSIGSRGGREGWGLCVRLMWSTMNTFISDRPFSSSFSTSAIWCVLMMMRKLIGIKIFMYALRFDFFNAVRRLTSLVCSNFSLLCLIFAFLGLYRAGRWHCWDMLRSTAGQKSDWMTLCHESSGSSRAAKNSHHHLLTTWRYVMCCAEPDNALSQWSLKRLISGAISRHSGMYRVRGASLVFAEHSIIIINFIFTFRGES